MKTDAEMGDATGGAVPVSHATSDNAKLRRANTAAILLRLISSALCIIAMVVMVTNEQTKRLVFPANPPIVISRKAKYTDVKALVFYSYVNGVVAGYLLLHAIYSIFASFKSGSVRLRLWATFIVDQLMIYVLIAAASVATEVSYIAKEGATKVAWEPVCDMFGKFCDQVGGSLIACFFGILVLAALVVISAYQLFGSELRAPRPLERNDAYEKTTATPAP